MIGNDGHLHPGLSVHIHRQRQRETQRQERQRSAHAGTCKHTKDEDADAHVGSSCPRKRLECMLVEEQRLDSTDKCL